MGRSVVLAGTDRCEGCRLPPRWCVCGALPTVESRVAIDVLLHRREQWRPSSTGALLVRALFDARLHIHSPDPVSRVSPVLPTPLFRPGHECLVLHPQGEPIGDELAFASRPLPLQVVLLDGTWREAGEMLRLVHATAAAAARGGTTPLRVVRLPENLPGRFWIRGTSTPGRLSTAEACAAILERLGEASAADRLRLHFELHVWATLRARGKLATAEAYLRESPLPAVIPEILAALEARRPA